MSDNMQHLLDTFGCSTAGFCRMAIHLANSELSGRERADLLAAMGIIARYIEPCLQFEDGGFAYFSAALRQDPDHWNAALEMLMLFKEQPDGHEDTRLAADCLKVVNARRSSLSDSERQLYDGAMRKLAMNGVAVESL